MIRSSIVDPYTGHHLKINGEGEVTATLHTHPPIHEKTVSYPFRQYLTDTGISSGSNDMIVASATNFYVSASQTVDIFIKRLSWRLGDTGTINLSTFGALSALTNGCDLTYRTNELGEVTLASALKTNLSLVRLGHDTAPVGTGADAFLLDVQGGGAEDTYLPVLDIVNTFGLPWGLRLRKGSLDKVVFKVKDNLTGLITFNCIATGVQL